VLSTSLCSSSSSLTLCPPSLDALALSAVMVPMPLAPSSSWSPLSPTDILGPPLCISSHSLRARHLFAIL
jgi:hypothetical protein